MLLNDEYNKYVLKRVRSLLNEDRDDYLVDLHIHTKHSADGSQTVDEVIQRSRMYGFDIISITDHDSIEAYKDIFSHPHFKTEDGPIIIPGVEFSVSHNEYRSRCHILKYFFDLEDNGFQDNITQNQKAYWKRVLLQFELIRCNQSLLYFSKKYNIIFDFQEYADFLSVQEQPIPEYPTVIRYIFNKLYEKGITVWDVYEKTVEFNSTDPCRERREKKDAALKRFYYKNRLIDIKHNYRKLSRILAIVGIDDEDYKEYPPSGNLSVNEYGQIKIHDMNNSGINIMAHPNNELLKTIHDYNHVLLGVECNYRSTSEQNIATINKAMELNLAVTIGSDSHTTSDDYFSDLSFYKMRHEELEKFYFTAIEGLNIEI